ncbi:SDR family oxidoreductase [Amycolatopsis sp. CA-230715]|uniref:SDR family oxidoreductase n=1 Tax=Amycolatopsis sp. CA-230715 TaxID=2745196 RepID=UPI001C01CBEF|nr:SDR family NAD(P)-dependent oxidoreductase [Amycolatopsis sp. CA-230715]QWF83897.1 3-phenylpropionate-dihydrodiol/cinnamic acid-dihydrodiol dehydrogenase [Amycolatopsis sp. CA-230715]
MRTTAVITGAATGIGRALAEALHARGARLILADVNADALAETATRLDATACTTDVADPDAMAALAEKAPRANLICLNAGIVGAALGAPWEVPPDDWDRVFAVNVSGVVNGLRAFVPRLLAAGESAHVLITGSLAGLTVFPGGGAYGPSKHAVVALAQHAAMVLADTPVSVSMICPALVATGMSAEGEDPADVAEQALRTIDDGVFAAAPENWQRTVVTQTTNLVAGRQPTPPVPAD